MKQPQVCPTNKGVNRNIRMHPALWDAVSSAADECNVTCSEFIRISVRHFLKGAKYKKANIGL